MSLSLVDGRLRDEFGNYFTVVGRATDTYVNTLEDRQLSGGLIPGAVDKRKGKEEQCGLAGCSQKREFVPYS